MFHLFCLRSADCVTFQVCLPINPSVPLVLFNIHYCGVIMGAKASQITSLTIVYWTVHLGTDQRKHQSSAALAFVQGIYRWPLNSPNKWPVTRKMFPFDDVIMWAQYGNFSGFIEFGWNLVIISPALATRTRWMLTLEHQFGLSHFSKYSLRVTINDVQYMLTNLKYSYIE